MRTSPRRSRFITVDPHRRNGRHLWSPIRGQPAEHARSERLRQALRQARSPVRARRAVGLQQLWIHTVGSRGRKGFRTELLRLRSRPHLQTSRHGLDRFVSLRARPCQAVRSAIFARPNTATLPPRGTSAGGGYSTVEDLLRFSNALLGRKLLNAEYT